jgi:hypothetical protein
MADEPLGTFPETPASWPRQSKDDIIDALSAPCAIPVTTKKSGLKRPRLEDGHSKRWETTGNAIDDICNEEEEVYSPAAFLSDESGITILLERSKKATKQTTGSLSPQTSCVGEGI